MVLFDPQINENWFLKHDKTSICNFCKSQSNTSNTPCIGKKSIYFNSLLKDMLTYQHKYGTMSGIWQRKSLIILFVLSMPWGINQLCTNLWRKMKNKIQSISISKDLKNQWPISFSSPKIEIYFCIDSGKWFESAKCMTG